LPPTTLKKRRTRSTPPLADKLRWAVGKEEEAAKTGRKREGERWETKGICRWWRHRLTVLTKLDTSIGTALTTPPKLYRTSLHVTATVETHEQ
jgi:hypothetical protein